MVDTIDRGRIVFGKVFIPVVEQYKEKYEENLRKNFLQNECVGSKRVSLLALAHTLTLFLYPEPGSKIPISLYS